MILGTKTKLEMISLDLVWFEVLYKDPDSRNNEIFQANVT